MPPGEQGCLRRALALSPLAWLCGRGLKCHYWRRDAAGSGRESKVARSGQGAAPIVCRGAQKEPLSRTPRGHHSPSIRRSNEGSRDGGDNGMAGSTMGHVEGQVSQ